MYKQEPFSRRGSLRSLRSAPLLSTVLESTLSLTRIHPITSLELPGLDYAVQSQSAISEHHRQLGTSLRSGIAAITAGTGVLPQPQTGRLGPQSSVRETKRAKQPQRALSRKLKPHIVADTVKQYISRAQKPAKSGQEQQPNMEFLRGVYAFMQVSRSSVDYNQGYESITTTAPSMESVPEEHATELSRNTTTTTRTTHLTATTCNKSASSINDSKNARINKQTDTHIEQSIKKSSKQDAHVTQQMQNNQGETHHKVLSKRKYQNTRQQQQQQ